MIGKPFPAGPVARFWRDLHSGIPRIEEELAELQEVASRKRMTARRTETAASSAEAEARRKQGELDRYLAEIARLEAEWDFQNFTKPEKVQVPV